jgi:hypothetical protein
VESAEPLTMQTVQQLKGSNDCAVSVLKKVKYRVLGGDDDPVASTFLGSILDRLEILCTVLDGCFYKTTSSSSSSSSSSSGSNTPNTTKAVTTEISDESDSDSTNCENDKKPTVKPQTFLSTADPGVQRARKTFEEYHKKKLLTPPEYSDRKEDDATFCRAVEILRNFKQGDEAIQLFPTIEGDSKQLNWQVFQTLLPGLYLSDFVLEPYFELLCLQSGKYERRADSLFVEPGGTWVLPFDFHKKIDLDPKYSYQQYKGWPKRHLANIRSITDLKRIVVPFNKPDSHFAALNVEMNNENTTPGFYWWDSFPGLFQEEEKDCLLHYIQCFLGDVEKGLTQNKNARPFHDWPNMKLQTLAVNKQFGVDCGLNLAKYVKKQVMGGEVEPEPTDRIQSAI